ncbi:MAG: hypothetical protein ACRD0K_11020 [Egibacteraceae bacterium]
MTMANWKDLVSSDAAHLVSAFIPDEAGDAAPFVAGRTYLRLWLADMFLAQDRRWFTDQYPAVQASIRLSFAGQQRTFTRVARPAKNQLGRGIWQDYQLSDLMPYWGGVVVVEGGLVAIKGDNLLSLTLDVLGDFASLVAPPLASALNIAEKVANGIDKLIGAGGDVALAYHRGFAAAGGGGQNVLRPGYLAVVGASTSKLDPRDLTVADSRLHRRSGSSSTPLTGYDYLVFRIEGRQERDDWRFPDLQRLLDQAHIARAFGKDDDFEALKCQLLASVVTSLDLTVPDRRRVALSIKEELEIIESAGLGALPFEPSTLPDIVRKRAIPFREAASLPPITLAELLG